MVKEQAGKKIGGRRIRPPTDDADVNFEASVRSTIELCLLSEPSVPSAYCLFGVNPPTLSFDTSVPERLSTKKDDATKKEVIGVTIRPPTMMIEGREY